MQKMEINDLQEPSHALIWTYGLGITMAQWLYTCYNKAKRVENVVWDAKFLKTKFNCKNHISIHDICILNNCTCNSMWATVS